MKEVQNNAPAWQVIPAPSLYEGAVAQMEAHAQAVAAGTAQEAVFMTSHAGVYTAGTSAKSEELLNPAGLPVVQTGRGGQWTWHGPGQLVLWPVLDLNQRRRDVRAYIFALEGWMIDVLACFGVSGERREGLPGIWVRRGDTGQPDRLDKIVAVGVRISKWVTMHGVALNHEPDLTQYNGIIPCGITDGGVTSLADLGLMISPEELEVAVKDCFGTWFGNGATMGRDITFARARPLTAGAGARPSTHGRS